MGVEGSKKTKVDDLRYNNHKKVATSIFLGGRRGRFGRDWLGINYLPNLPRNLSGLVLDL